MKRISILLMAMLSVLFMKAQQPEYYMTIDVNQDGNGEVIVSFEVLLTDSSGLYQISGIDSTDWDLYGPNNFYQDYATGPGINAWDITVQEDGTYTLFIHTFFEIENMTTGGLENYSCMDTITFQVDDFAEDMCNLGASYYIEYPDMGQQNGAIYLDVFGGSGDYAYEWSTGAQTQDLLDIGSGIYSVTITDLGDSGCSVTLYDIYVEEMDNSWNGQYVDSFSTVIDTCLPSFDVDTFYLDNIVFNSDTTEFSITWNFVIDNDTFQIEEIYEYIEAGYYWLSLGFNCSGNFNKAVTSYGRSVYIYPTLTSIENATIANLNIYPQPVKDNLNISLYSNISGKVNVNIYSLDGRLVSSTPKTLVSGNNLLHINVNSLTNGAYMISIEKGKDKLWTSKLLK